MLACQHHLNRLSCLKTLVDERISAANNCGSLLLRGLIVVFAAFGENFEMS